MLDNEFEEQPEAFYNESEGDASDDDQAPRCRARRHSKKAFNPRSDDPTHTAFYPDTWQEVLNAGKMHWRVLVATEWGFPKLRDRKPDILACLTQAITEYENENGSLEEGMSHKLCRRFAILMHFTF